MWHWAHSCLRLFNKYLSNTYYVPGTVTGVGETVWTKWEKKFCLRGADILVSSKQARTCGICCLIIRGIDVCWHLLCAPVLQSVLWRSSKNVGAIILKELKILASWRDAWIAACRLGVSRDGSESWLCHSLAVWSWACLLLLSCCAHNRHH